MTSPAADLIAKLQSGRDACWLGIGDSTYYGVGDVTFTGGWPPTFGRLIGQYVGCTVRNGNAILYSPPGGGTGATLRLRSIGGPGTTFANDLAYINQGQFSALNTAGTPPDVVIMWGGINDLSIGGITANTIGPAVKTIVDRIRTDFGSNPKIIIGNQSPTIGLAYNAGYAGLFGYFSSQSALPLTPALLPGTGTYPNLWCLDSHQAFGVIGTTDTLGFGKWMYEGLHPNRAGYDRMAQWMFELLIAPPLPPAGSAPAFSTFNLDAIRNRIPFEQTLTATGSTPMAWSITSGSLPTGITLNGATGVISGTTFVSGPFSFTVRASNSFGTSDRQFSGVVDFYPQSQLNNLAKPKHRKSGFYHPAAVKVRVNGSFKTPALRD